MGRPPKRSLLPHEEVVRIQKLANSAAPSNMPEHTHLRGQIVIALTERIKKFRPEDYNHCRGAIAAIAKIEAMTEEDLPVALKAKEIEKLLEELTYVPAAEFTHSPRALSIQRESLIDFLIAKQYPIKDDIETRKRWIKKEWERILELVTVVPCRCKYELSYNAFVLKLRGQSRNFSAHADTADLLISTIHDSIDPESVRKYARIPS